MNVEKNEKSETEVACRASRRVGWWGGEKKQKAKNPTKVGWEGGIHKQSLLLYPVLSCRCFFSWFGFVGAFNVAYLLPDRPAFRLPSKTKKTLICFSRTGIYHISSPLPSPIPAPPSHLFPLSTRTPTQPVHPSIHHQWYNRIAQNDRVDTPSESILAPFLFHGPSFMCHKKKKKEKEFGRRR